VVVAGLWAGRLTGRWPLPRAVLGTAAVAGGTAVVVTAVAGTGFGWVAALGTPVSAHNWSLSSAAGRLGALVLRLAGSDAAAWAADHAIAAWRWFGFAAAAAAALLVWSRRTRLGPVYALGLILGALVVFGPAIRPWYLLWGLIPLAAAAPPGVPRQWSAAACGVLALAVLPDGFGPDLVEIGRAAAGGAVAVAIVLAADLTRPTETVTGTTREGTTTAAAGTAEYPP